MHSYSVIVFLSGRLCIGACSDWDGKRSQSTKLFAIIKLIFTWLICAFNIGAVPTSSSPTDTLYSGV